MTGKPTITYRDAGVDIDAGNAFVERIKKRIAATFRPGVLTGLGGFGGLFELDVTRYRAPVLVAATDGVGTKLKLAIEHDRHAEVGIDLVAMCVNDLVVQGAEPLFFLDYFATGKLDIARAASVVDGIARGCEQAGAALIGGETAEMPGMYRGDDYDLAGFSVGVVEKTALISPERVNTGDVILGLASSGPHSNGYSLIRKLLEGVETDAVIDGRPLVDTLLEPTRIYVKPLLATTARHRVSGLAHVTGGGLTDNLPRALPPGAHAEIDLASWEPPAIFAWLSERGNIDGEEMLRTFNCGIGMAVIVPPGEALPVADALRSHGETVHTIGRVVAGAPGVSYLR
jgi:phosphoribosylformylglycinamidine cyclo-ligase